MKDQHLEADFSVLPPYSPEKNAYNLPLSTCFKSVCNEREEKLQQRPLNKDCKPTSTYPIVTGGDDETPIMWSLELNDETVISAKYSGGLLAVV